MDLDTLCKSLRRYGIRTYVGPVEFEGKPATITLEFNVDGTTMSFEPMTDNKRDQEEADRARHDAIALALGNHPPLPEDK